MATAAAPSNAINIHVFRNGDSYYKGRKFVVNHRQTRDFESFLSMVTTGVRPQYGAVRKLYTPTHGHKVCDLSKLENNKHYVAAGMERFRQVEYFSIGRPNGQRHPNILQRSVIRPVAHSRIKASARIRKPTDGPRTIHVYRNGDTLYPSVRLLLTKRMLSNWDTVLEMITDRVNLISGAVRRLWHMDGSRVIELSEIDNEGTFVASGNERFKKVAYGMSGPLEPSSPRIRRPAPPKKQKPTLLVPKKTPKLSPKSVPAQKTTPRKPLQPKPPDKRKKKEKTAEQKEAESVFHSRPAIVKRSRENDGGGGASLDFSEGENGVFKAKDSRKETRGAAEVDETQETAVDLPIDQVKAEEVDDEIVEESHDQLGNHVTQSTVPGATEGDEKSLANGGIKQEKTDQLNHINAAGQAGFTSENYNNNNPDDEFAPDDPPITGALEPELEIAGEMEAGHTAGKTFKEVPDAMDAVASDEPGEEAVAREMEEAGEVEEGSKPLLGGEMSKEAEAARIKVEGNKSSLEENHDPSVDLGVNRGMNGDNDKDHTGGGLEDVGTGVPQDLDPVCENDHAKTSKSGTNPTGSDSAEDGTDNAQVGLGDDPSVKTVRGTINTAGLVENAGTVTGAQDSAAGGINVTAAIPVGASELLSFNVATKKSDNGLEVNVNPITDARE